MSFALEAEHLVKTYRQGDTEVRALSDVSIAVEPGEVVALLGPSGSGKSTLLTALGLLNLPERGVIRLGGVTVVEHAKPLRDLAALRRSRLGFVFQKANLVPFLTALENVALALDLNDVGGAEARSRAGMLLDYLGLDTRHHAYPEQLSGGQQQRVAIARALAVSPPVLLADEPTAALDGNRSRDVMGLLRRIADENGTAVVVVTHDHRTLSFFDTIYDMEDGVLTRRDEAPEQVAAP